jgi:small subunit ribosomal protein S12e
MSHRGQDALKILVTFQSTIMAEEYIAAGGVMDINTVMIALIRDGLAHGTPEAAKALNKHQAHLGVLASNYDELSWWRPFVLSTNQPH